MRIGVIPESLIERVLLALGVVPTPLLESIETMFLARTLLVATQAGVFDALEEGPRGAAEVAAQLGTDPRATAKLLDALVGCRYLRFDGGRYALARVARRWLLAGSKPSLRDNLLFRSIEWDLLGRLGDFVRTGRSLDVHATLVGDDWGVYQRGMRSMAGLSAEEVAQRTPVPEQPHEMLDIGGSHGFYSVCFCRRHPTLHATILDLPQAVEHAAPILAREEMGDRVVHRAGDALADDLGSERYDLVFMAQLVHHFDDAQNRALVGRVARALRPGGTFAVGEILRPAQPGAGGQLGALLDLYFALTSESGTWTADEIASWQREAGLAPLPAIRLRTAPGAAVVAATKPG